MNAKLRAPKKPRAPTKRAPREKCVPSSATMQAMVQSFVSNLATGDRPEILGCLVVLAWRKPRQVHTQSVMFATDDDVGEILLSTARGHEIETAPVRDGHVGHA